MTFFLVVEFSRSAVPDSLQPHEPQHARLPCPSTPGALGIKIFWGIMLTYFNDFYSGSIYFIYILLKNRLNFLEVRKHQYALSN